MGLKDAFYESVTKIVEVPNFSRRTKYEFITTDIKGKVDMGLEVRIYVVHNKHVSIYITKETDNESLSEFRMTCMVSVIDKECSERFTQSFGYIHQYKSEVFIIGIEKCFNWVVLQKNSAELFIKDILLLKFQLSYEGIRVNKIHRVFASSLNAMLNQYFGDEEINFIIETMEGAQHKLPFSKSLESLYSKLKCSSPVFQCLLEKPFKDKLTRKIKIDDFDSGTLSAFLTFIDTEMVIWSTDLNDVYSLYEMADKYEVLDLQRKCSQHLAKHLDTFTKKDMDDVMDIATLAVMHCDQYLKGALASYFNKKETLLIGKINTVKLYELAKKVKLIPLISEENITFETFENTQLTWKWVLMMKRTEDPCILFQIAEEFKVHDLYNESLRYMKQTISVENAPKMLSLMKRCHNPNSLKFVVDFMNCNKPYSSNEELKKELQFLLGSTTSSSTFPETFIESSIDEENDDVSKYEFYQ